MFSCPQDIKGETVDHLLGIQETEEYNSRFGQGRMQIPSVSFSPSRLLIIALITAISQQ